MSQPYPTVPPPQPGWSPQPPPKPFNWRRYALWTTLAAAAAFGICGAIAATVDDDTPDPAACKAALERSFDQALANGTQPNGTPGECAGVDDQTMQRLATEVTAEEVGKGIKDAWGGGETAQP